MILVDAVFINVGGGKILLDYLISKLELTHLNITYLLDKRVENKIQLIKSSNSVLFIEPSLKVRNNFYRNNKVKFSKIFILKLIFSLEF